MSSDTITFLGAPSVVAAKTWTPEGCVPYAIGAGPFHAKAFAVASLDELSALLQACPSNAFVVRGAAAAEVIPYRRHRTHGTEFATLTACAHRWLAVDADLPGAAARTDLPAMALEARAMLGPPWSTARAFAVATSSAGMVPGIRVRLWFWCSREVSDEYAKALLANTGADLAIYTPSQPCYCAAPIFDNVPDPFEGASRYTWLEGAPEVEIPESYEAHRAAAPLNGFGRAAAGAVVGNRNAHLASVAGSLRRRGASEGVLEAALTAANKELLEPLPDREVAAIARSIAQYAPEPAAETTAQEWSQNAIVNDEGGLVACAENFGLLLQGHPAFGLWLNTRTGRPVWSTCPWRPAATPVGDGDDFQMRRWISRYLGWHRLPCDILAGVAEVAAAKPYDPWRGYLDGLVWDGVPRLDTAAARLLGDNTQSAARTFTWWLMSGVARSFVPGVQADHMIVLEGEQGVGKTTFLRELAVHEAFFTRLSAHSDLSNVRTIGKIHGPVIVELAELDTVRRAGVEAMKAFVDERIDRVQWLYARSQVDVPRSCIFAGTSNDSDYLKDTTGNRRYWPITASTVDLDALKAERAQLWAEATARYRAGEAWWPTDHEATALGLVELQESRRAPAAVEETLLTVLAATYAPGMHALSGVAIYQDQVAAGQLQWATVAQLTALAKCKDFEVQSAMRVLKWTPARKRLSTGHRVRVYMRPT